MEFEFYVDALGEPKAHFSMGYEVFAHCLNEQYQQSVAISELILLLHKAIESERAQGLSGRFYTLEIQGGEVAIKDNSLHETNEFEVLDDDALSGFAFEASCGLEDFISMIDQWQEFVLDF